MITIPREFFEACVSDNKKLILNLMVTWDVTMRVDETANLESATVNHIGYNIGSPELVPLGNTNISSIVLRNEDRRYSAHNAASPLYAHINGADAFYGKRIVLSAGFENSSSLKVLPIVTGYIYTAVEDPINGTVTLEVRDNGMVALQRRLSNELDINKSVTELIEKYANIAGIIDIKLDDVPFRIDASWLEDDSILDECRKLAASVGGVIFFNSSGELVFQSAENWLKQPIRFRFRPDHFHAMPFIANPDHLASEVIVDYSPRGIGLSEVLYDLDNPQQVLPAGGEHIFTCRLRQPAVSLDVLRERVHYWFANSSGVDLNEHCTVEYVTVGGTTPAQQVNVKVVNNHPDLAATLVFFNITGTPIIGQPSSVKKEKTGYTAYERERSVTGNFYIQNEFVSSFLVSLLSERYQGLLKVWNIDAFNALPHLEIGDRVAFYDNSVIDAPADTSPPPDDAGEEAWRDGYIVAIQYQVPHFSAKYTVVDRRSFYRNSTAASRGNYFTIGIDCPDHTPTPPVVFH